MLPAPVARVLIEPMALILLSSIALLLAVIVVRRSRSRHRFPPGPKGLPLFGNIFQIPPFQFIQFTEWKTQFGPIFSLNLAGQQVVVINSINVAVDLLERRSGVYSDRPRFIMAGEVLTGGLFLSLIKYGDSWRKLRKAAHEGLKSQVMPTYQPAQELEAVIFVENMIQRPGSWIQEIKRSTASATKTAVYGTPPITSDNDPVVEYITGLGHRITISTTPGRYLVESFPKMLYLPTWLARWKREAIEGHKKDTQELESIVRPVKENKSHRPSFAAKLHLASDRHHLTQKEEAWLCGTMFVAGSDTVGSAMAFFILAMRLYPEVMRKAQTEIDRVIGRERVPIFSDRDKLPYVRAVVKELLRWAPVAPLGVPRQAYKDDHYGSYFIAKGTLVLINAWGINNDPQTFSSPHEFRPERFLDPSGTIDVVIPGTRNQGHVTFGFGRSRPKPFRCNIAPRFSGVEEILRRAREEKSS
ncbi:cytochrome P450 [Pluteus cervinus]|uniref:Cytochrome P450 n=1 Tax=Pluteus cervinus TaxID=181527 RepID=A0ACD3AEP7_9AGAR|nr:cytochrome P450 [Pluteus cervinus]